MRSAPFSLCHADSLICKTRMLSNRTRCADLCVQRVACSPFCAWVCVQEKKPRTAPKPSRLVSHRESGRLSPTPGWLWHCEQAADPPRNQNILYLVAISPHLASGLRHQRRRCLPPPGEQGMPQNSPFPSLGAPPPAKQTPDNRPAPSKAPFPREGLCNPGLPCPAPSLHQLKAAVWGHLTTLQFKAKRMH